jgi:hypothetical protein
MRKHGSPSRSDIPTAWIEATGMKYMKQTRRRCEDFFRPRVIMSSTATAAYHSNSQRPAFLNVFMIVGKDDKPLFACDLSSDGVRDDSPHLDEFIIHAALDAVDSLLVCPPFSKVPDCIDHFL